MRCHCINVDTPFQVEDESVYDALILVFGFRGSYTAQLTKIFPARMQAKLNYKHLIVVGEEMFSEKECPAVASSLKDIAEHYSFHSYFMKGQLRVVSLTGEELVILKKFSELTGMKINDMGEFNPKVAKDIARQIEELLDGLQVPADPNAGKAKRICTVCGYVHSGAEPPKKCSQCGQGASVFKKL